MSAFEPVKARTVIPAVQNPPIPDAGDGLLYRACALDLGSRRWLGYAMADHRRTELAADALTMAVDVRVNIGV